MRVDRQFKSGSYARFGFDVLDVVINGVSTDDKLIGNLALRLALRQQIDNLFFSLRQFRHIHTPLGLVPTITIFNAECKLAPASRTILLVLHLPAYLCAPN